MQVCGFYVDHKSKIKTSGKMGNVIKKSNHESKMKNLKEIWEMLDIVSNCLRYYRMK
jgi:hypothetical protein